jgi:condensin complex subunit 3
LSSYDEEIELIVDVLGWKDEENASTEGPSSRFTTKLLKHLLSGSTAKDKSVRYRIVQILTTLLSSLGEIDDDLYEPLRATFLERAHDKEPAIRVQAVLGLAKLMGGEDEDELEEDEQSLKEVVLGLMRFDPAAEVRRASLYNLPLQPETITPILSRSRDIDPVLRKSLYTTILGNKAIPDMRVLTIHQREGLIKNGLGDRETGVRNAAAGMVSGWLGEPANKEEALNTVDRIVQVSSPKIGFKHPAKLTRDLFLVPGEVRSGFRSDRRGRFEFVVYYEKRAFG